MGGCMGNEGLVFVKLWNGGIYFFLILYLPNSSKHE